MEPYLIECVLEYVIILPKIYKCLGLSSASALEGTGPEQGAIAIARALWAEGWRAGDAGAGTKPFWAKMSLSILSEAFQVALRVSQNRVAQA